MLSFLLPAIVAAGGWATSDTAKIAKGREVYQLACAQCHGQDGKGNPEWESAVRPVAFGECGNTGEPTEHWESIVKHGGKSAGLASVMPAFAEAFSDEEISAAVAYIRTFCEKADAYPPGDLNFRRPLQTGKAFPEQEVVLRLSHRPESGAKETEMELAYENRIGSKFQYEFVAPFRVQSSGEDGTGIGDVEIELKQVVAFSQKKLSILSLGIGAVLPSGSESKGTGSGTALIGPFAAAGKAFARGRTMLQARVGAEISTNSDKADTEIQYAAALSQSLGPPRHAFVPALEFTGAYNTKTKTHDYSLWIEMSKPLNRLGHVIASVGTQIPLRPKGDTYRIEAFLLWDFGDGPITVGW